MSSHRLLIVEGDDDAHVVRNLLGRHGIAADLTQKAEEGALAIKPVGGVDKLPSSISYELKVNPNLQTLGVIADADESAKEAWRSLWDALHTYGEKTGYPALKSEGWVGSVPTYQTDTVRSGGWIMPDNQSDGAVEEFAGRLVPEGDTLWEYSEEVIRQLPEQRFDDKDEEKARIHTWLAWQNPPREPIGRAITQGTLNAESELATRFVAWVRRLFDLDGSAAKP